MTPSLFNQPNKQLLPWPPKVASARVARQLEDAYRAYALAFAKALAVDHPAGAYQDVADSEKESLRTDRWSKTAPLELAYVRILERVQKPKNAQKVQAKAAQVQKQVRLFADAWPSDFDYIAERFPRKPFVANDLSFGTKVRPIEQAGNWRYVQYNNPVSDHLLIIDYDCENGLPVSEVWKSAGLLPPAWIATTPGTKKGHLAWSLETPVCTTSAARSGPLRYLASIEQAYRTAISGDAGFAGLLTKNPIHQTAWEVEWINPTPYKLSDLASVVQLPKPSKKAVVAPIGLGRKITTFDTVREWAYTAIPDFWSLGKDVWDAEVRRQVDKVNKTFLEPLPESHLRSISKSVAKWVWKNFTPLTKHQLVIATHSPAVQALRGARKGAKKRDALMTQAKAMLDAGRTQAEVALELGVSQGTVSNWRRRNY
jgi:hypothetical protein